MYFNVYTQQVCVMLLFNDEICDYYGMCLSEYRFTRDQSPCVNLLNFDSFYFIPNSNEEIILLHPKQMKPILGQFIFFQCDPIMMTTTFPPKFQSSYVLGQFPSLILCRFTLKLSEDGFIQSKNLNKTITAFILNVMSY